jgi:hypothetical protein
MKTTFWMIQRADGKVYAGLSSITRQPMWFSYDDAMEMSEILRVRKTNARLIEAQKSAPDAKWIEY